MRRLAILVITGVSIGLSGAAAQTTVNLDFVGATNGVSIFEDSFDNGILDMPPWFVLGGAPGPEAGTTLRMHGGDFMVANIPANPNFDLSVRALMNLTSFPAGSFAALMIFGDDAGERFSLGAIPGGALFLDAGGSTLGFAALPPSPTANLVIDLSVKGMLHATANGIDVYNGETNIGKVVGVGILVVPEPGTIVLLGSALVLLCCVRARKSYALCSAA